MGYFTQDFTSTVSLNYLNEGGLGSGVIQFIILIILSCVACRHNREIRNLHMAYMLHKTEAQNLENDKSVFEKMFGKLPALESSQIKNNFNLSQDSIQVMAVSDFIPGNDDIYLRIIVTAS